MKTVKNTIFLLLLIALPALAQRTTTPTRKPAAPAPAPPAKAAAAEPETINDLKIKTRMEMQGLNMDSTVYIKGERERTEQTLPGMNLQMVTIKECDLRRDIQINDNAKVYKIDPFGDNTPTTTAPKTTTAPPPPPSNKPTRKGGVVTINVTMTDTGERKEMFGYQARHLKMAMSFTSSPDACSKANMRMETDGWYINFRSNFSCREDFVPRQAIERGQRSKPDCMDEWKYNVQGNVKIGYPADVTMTMFDDKGKPFSTRQQILELSRAKLDQALFEIPAGYTEGDPYSMRAMMGGIDLGSIGKMAGDASRRENSSTASVAAKKAGVVRLGIVQPSAKIGSNDVGEGVRSTLMRYINGGASLEVIPLSSAGEASSKQCDFVMTSSLTHTPGKSGGGLGGFMKKAAAVGGQIASGTMGSGSSSPQSAADASSSIKSKDEVSYDYQVTRADGSSVASNSQKRKANSDGEDVISPMLSQVAGEVLRVVLKK